jgi:oligoribonuclease NrnB/cAMP/cGMP phosphodiesterase (DHH superfamily)
MIIKKDILVIYHADCLDGFGAAWSAFKTFGHQARYVAARFNEPFVKHSLGCEIYILDFCYSPEITLKALETAQQITILDHHLTAIQEFDDFFSTHPIPEKLVLRFDIKRSGCVLAWQYFFPKIEIPVILLHIEDRDLWQFKIEGTKEITTALYEQMPLSFNSFDSLNLKTLFSVGRIQVRQFSKMVQRLAKNAYFVKLAGSKGLAVNAPSFFSSELGNRLAEQSGTFGMIYQYDGKHKKWIFALRSVGDFNVGEIAKYFDGGGHINSAGFTLPNNPFLPS